VSKYITILIGKRSNLTQAYIDKIGEAISIHSSDVTELKSIINNFSNVNIIYNTFFQSSLLNDFDDPKKYSAYTFETLSEFISICKENSKNINSLIYTSSSSVYGNNNSASETCDCKLLNLYSTMKLASEMFLREHIKNTPVKLIVARVFNMYGGRDNYSIVSKIATALNNNSELTISNQGNSIRDFIDIRDVVFIYSLLLRSNFSGTVNLSTGRGMKIIEIINIAESVFGKQLKYLSKEKSEIDYSVGNTTKLKSIIGEFSFRDVKNYYAELFSI
jgi:UDP-glucose 4-epimerase